MSTAAAAYRAHQPSDTALIVERHGELVRRIAHHLAARLPAWASVLFLVQFVFGVLASPIWLLVWWAAWADRCTHSSMGLTRRRPGAAPAARSPRTRPRHPASAPTGPTP